MMNVEIKAPELEFWFNRIYKEDIFHGQFAPIKLSVEMINKLEGKVNWGTAKIAVLYDLSLLMVVWEKVKTAGGNFQNITYFCSFEEKKRFAEALGVKVEYIEQGVLVNWLKGKHNMEFDVVLGNPPYQGKKLGGGDGSGNAIWQHFVNLSFKIAKEDGYVCLIHPSSWRFGEEKSTGKSKSKYEAQTLLFSKQLVYLKTQFPFPGAGVIVDFYVAQNRDGTDETTCEFLDTVKKFKIFGDIRYINHYQDNVINSILSKVFKTKDNGFFSRKSWGGLSIKNTSAPKGNYPFVKSSGISKGKFQYEEFPHIHQNDKKVLISAIRELRAYYDKGQYGIDDHLHYVLVASDKEGKFLETVYNSELMIFLQGIFATTFWNTTGGSFWNTSKPLSQILPEEVELSSDEDVYKHYDLSIEEIDFIKNFLISHS